MDCVGPIIVFLVVVAQIVVQVRKGQELARRRAMDAQNAPPPGPITRRATYEANEGLDDDAEESPRTVPYDPSGSRRIPQDHAPPPLPSLAAPAFVRRAALPSTAIPEVVRRRRIIRLDAQRLRSAIILTEILSPPVAMR